MRKILPTKGIAASIVVALAFFTAPAMSASLFEIDIQIDGRDDSDGRKMFSYDTVEELFEAVELDDLAEEFPAYMNENALAPSTVMAAIDYRGIRVQLNFPNSADEINLLEFKVPSLGIDLEFTGLSRDASLDLLEDFLEGEGSSIINRINKLLIAESPVDPVAGNPSSLLSTMADRAFSTTAGTGPPRPVASAGQVAQRGGLFSLGARFGRYNQGGNKINSYTLPLGYSFETESGKEFEINFPITYVETETAASYKVGLDFAYKHPVTDKWTLSPIFGYGVVGSADLASSGQIGSLALTSLYQFHESTGGWTFHIANMGGVYKTFPIKIKGVDIDPGISNQIIKNGLIGRIDRDLFSSPVVIEIYLTDTRFFGDELYSEQYNEIGLHFKPQKARGLKKHLGFNATYLNGERDVDGFKLSLSYKF